MLPQDNVKAVLRRFFDTHDKRKCVLVGILYWGLWYRRNKWVWERVTQSIFGLKSMVFNMLVDWKKVKEEG